jgi:hypothetical protein
MATVSIFEFLRTPPPVVELIDNVEMTRIQANVVNALESGNEVMKSLRAELSVDKVQEVRRTRIQL